MKPWYNVVYPRDDLREGRPLDAAEFAVHLDQVRDGRAPGVYQNVQQFFERTYLTRSLTSLATEAIRRLSGIQTEASAVFNFITQFGGGKTHALTLLYHLARSGPSLNTLPGVPALLSAAGVHALPQAAVAVFVGTEFDTTSGRGGRDGTPLRKTPWGEIAYQLRGEEGLALVAEHDQQLIAPAGDVIREMLPTDRPCLILMDELLTYASRNRKLGMPDQLYHFLQSLSETVRGAQHAVLAVSIPKSLLEMTPEDENDYDRLEKLLNRLGKGIILSAEYEISEIIRRRLFEWDLQQEGPGGSVMLPHEAQKTCSEYAHWMNNHRQLLPNWFAVDHANATLNATYPFHPSVLSVFERKWQGIPRFQRTRGMLRMLALWVSHAYQQGFKGAHRDPLIDLGTAPLDDPLFRAAVLEQLGESRLEIPITTDICGSNDSHALRLDENAVDTLRKGRLHRKIATTIFFESNGGQAQGYTTLPEVRLGVAAPDLDIANVETVLEALSPPDGACYYLHTEKNRYWFSIKPTLTRILADRKASIQPTHVQERIETEIQAVFRKGAPFQPLFFPDSSSQIPDRPTLAMVVMRPDQTPKDQTTMATLEKMTRECGSSGRTYKSGLIWVLAEGDTTLKEEARKLLAWGAIQDEQEGLRLDEQQQRKVTESMKRSTNDLRESVWRSYHYLLLLHKDNTLQTIDLGMVHSSAASSLIQLFLNHLHQNGEIEEDISPQYLLRNWPPFTEWSTKGVRDAFFATPRFPRLLDGTVVRQTIARGVANGSLAYVGKSADEHSYDPFYYCPVSGSTRDIPPEYQHLSQGDVEISDDMFIIARETAEAYLQELRKVRTLTRLEISPPQLTLRPGDTHIFTASGFDQEGEILTLQRVTWNANGGTINQEGFFTADANTGTFDITATVGQTRTSAMVTITEDIRLARLTIDPAQVTLTPGKRMRFTMQGFDQHGREMVIPAATWAASGGTVNQDGTFVAGDTSGSFDVTVTAETIAASARVTIEQGGARKVTWQGTVPPQKWMNFYTRAASQFSINQGLTFIVQMEVAPPDGLTEHQIEALKAALRELGLDDDVEIG